MTEKRSTWKIINDVALLVMVVTWIGYIGWLVWREAHNKPTEMIISHSIAPPPDVVP